MILIVGIARQEQLLVFSVEQLTGYSVMVIIKSNRRIYFPVVAERLAVGEVCIKIFIDLLEGRRQTRAVNIIIPYPDIAVSVITIEFQDAGFARHDPEIRVSGK